LSLAFRIALVQWKVDVLLAQVKCSLTELCNNGRSRSIALTTKTFSQKAALNFDSVAPPRRPKAPPRSGF
jgi:hypothetical protein